MSESLELELQEVVGFRNGCWELNSGPLGEQEVLLNAELSIQLLYFSLNKSCCVCLSLIADGHQGGCPCNCEKYGNGQKYAGVSMVGCRILEEYVRSSIVGSYGSFTGAS